MKDRIEKVVELKAPVARVWRALTDHKEFGQWFRVDLDGPFRVGERSHGKVTYPGHEHLAWESTTVRMEPERLFSFSWSPVASESDTEDAEPITMLVEFMLEATPEGTRLTIRESGFSKLPEKDRIEVFRRNEGGWEEQAKNIAAHVEG